ncbi:MAG TPA: hypothetical protein VIP05_11230 [Burkholderiaceae bacterium]
MKRHLIKTLVVQLVLAFAAAAPLTPVPALAHGDAPAGDVDLHKLLAQARRATAPFTDLQAALAAGYTKFPDLHGDCVAQAGQGGMGIHYLNAALLDGELDPMRPEFLVYHKTASGQHELLALEYVVFAPVWDALHAQPPVLFGHPFHLVRTPNRYGTPMPFYELHVWLWEHNPDGLFNDWNPRVSCN